MGFRKISVPILLGRFISEVWSKIGSSEFGCCVENYKNKNGPLPWRLLFSAIEMSRHTLNSMVERQFGRIVNVSSVAV